MGSTGNNGCMLLGICPDKAGRFHDTDMQILKNFGKDLRLHFGYNLLTEGAALSASSEMSAVYSVRNAADLGDGFWMPDAGDARPYLDIRFEKAELFDKMTICENTRNGQRIESFEIWLPDKRGVLRPVYAGKTVGARKICELRTSEADRLRVVFTGFRDTPQILSLSLN